MILQYFQKKENKDKKYALSKYSKILEISNNFIKNNNFFKNHTFNTSFEIVSIILLIHIKLIKDIKINNYKKINEYLINSFISDLDESLRINGIADMSIGKYVKSYVKKFYFRLSKFDKISKTSANNIFYEYFSIFDIILDERKKEASKKMDIIYKSIVESYEFS